MKRFTFLFVMLNIAFVVSSNCQTKVTGWVLDSNGHGIEYATICVDSVFCISDADGHFNLQLPQNASADMSVSHISFKTKLIPRSTFQQGGGEYHLRRASLQFGKRGHRS